MRDFVIYHNPDSMGFSANELTELSVVTNKFVSNIEGGTLLLGVSDDGTVLGLKHDYQTLQKKNADGYELFLGDLLLTHYGKDLSRFLKFSFHELDSKQVCRIAIGPAPRAAWVKEGNEEHLYVRAGNSTRRLSTREAIEYCKTRF